MLKKEVWQRDSITHDINDLLEPLSKWKEWNFILEKLHQECDSDKVWDLRHEQNTPREVEKILEL